MSTRTICDRCKNPISFLESRTYMAWFHKPKQDVCSHFKLEDSRCNARFDFCPECNKEFHKFMEGYKMSDETIHQSSIVFTDL